MLKLKVLVVDDSVTMRRTVRVALEKLGHKVICEASNGTEAIKKFKRFKPDLVTMDIAMPNMNGLVAVRELKKIDDDAKIIMVTSMGDEIKVMDAIVAGAKGYILKPISQEPLLNALSKIFPEDENILEDVFMNLYDKKPELDQGKNKE